MRLIYPNVANLHRGKTRQGASDVASRSLWQVEAYLTVREILPETSKGVPPCRDALVRAERFWPVQVCIVRVNIEG